MHSKTDTHILERSGKRSDMTLKSLGNFYKINWSSGKFINEDWTGYETAFIYVFFCSILFYGFKCSYYVELWNQNTYLKSQGP